MLIGMAGSPCSGKSTLSAMLYAEFMKQGVEGAYLIHEYAKTHLAKGKPIKEVFDQIKITDNQRNTENEIRRTSFNPIICDSCLWLGKVYLELNGWTDHHYIPILMNDFKAYEYDVTIFVPLQDITGEASEYRVHDGMQAAKIDYLIRQELSTKKNVMHCPVDYKERDEWVKEFVKQWKEKYNGRGSSESSQREVG